MSPIGQLRSFRYSLYATNVHRTHLSTDQDCLHSSEGDGLNYCHIAEKG